MAKKRQIPCPYCSGEVLSEQNGRTSSSASLFPKFQNIVIAISDLLSLITGNTVTISRREAVGGKCEACDNKGFFDDPSDTTAGDKAALSILENAKDKFDTEAAKMGSSPGGSRLTRIAGADVLLVGHQINKAESVAVKKGVPGPGGGSVGASKTGAGRGGVPKGSKDYNHVQGLNVPANSGGGHYVIQCANKFNLVVGAQGASIDTYGALKLHGKAGVQITGAEVVIGTSVGGTSIGGNNINLEGENINVTASGKSGTVNVNGSMQATGNVQSGGAYFDNVYFAKGTCPSKETSVKGGSTTSVNTGPALWGGNNAAAIRAATLQLKEFVEERSLDLDLFKAGGPTTPRFALNMRDQIYNLTYAAIPLELKVTGICTVLYGSSAGFHPIFNFPHTHAMHDNLHTHRVTVPALNYEQNSTADLVRKAADSAGINTSVAAAGGTGESIVASAIQKVGGLMRALGGKKAALSDHGTMAA
jgi:hypothetical protein